MPPITSPTKALCNRCGVWTNQRVVHCETVEWDDELGEGCFISGGDEYHLLRCLGCDKVSLLHKSWFSEDTDAEGDPSINQRRYPAAAATRLPSWMTAVFPEAPRQVANLLREIYVALHDESYRLCAIGLRALIEDIMIDQVGDQGAIGKNIDAFMAKGYVAPAAEGDFKTRIIEAGHTAMHRGHKPSQTDIISLLDITEALIASIYVHPHQLRRMSQPPKRIASQTTQTTDKRVAIPGNI